MRQTSLSIQHDFAFHVTLFAKFGGYGIISFRAASSVSAAMKALKAADLIYRTEAGYIVYDRLFGIWLSQLP